MSWVLQEMSVLRELSGGMGYFRAYTHLTASKDAPWAHLPRFPPGPFTLGARGLGLLVAFGRDLVGHRRLSAR